MGGLDKTRQMGLRRYTENNTDIKETEEKRRREESFQEADIEALQTRGHQFV